MTGRRRDLVELTDAEIISLFAGEVIWIGRCEVSAAQFRQGQLVHLRTSEEFSDTFNHNPGVKRTCDGVTVEPGWVRHCHEPCEHQKWLASPLCDRHGSRLYPLDPGSIEQAWQTRNPSWDPARDGDPDMIGELAGELCLDCVELARRVGFEDLCPHDSLELWCAHCHRAWVDKNRKTDELRAELRGRLAAHEDLLPALRRVGGERALAANPKRAGIAHAIAVARAGGLDDRDITKELGVRPERLEQIEQACASGGPNPPTGQERNDGQLEARGPIARHLVPEAAQGCSDGDERDVLCGHTPEEVAADCIRKVRAMVGAASTGRVVITQLAYNPHTIVQKVHALAMQAVGRGATIEMLRRELRSHRAVAEFLVAGRRCRDMGCPCHRRQGGDQHVITDAGSSPQ